MKTMETDVLVIGAGPAGALAAALLHQEKIPLLVVEKQTFPRFVIGESLLPCSMNMLQNAGLLEAVEARRFMRKHGAVFLRGGQRCDFDFAEQSGDGWKYTYQVPRADFDQALIDAVIARGGDVRFQHSVTAVDFSPERARATVEHNGEKMEVKAQFILDCSGYGRVLPRLLDLEQPSSQPPRAALFTHIAGDQRPLEREEGKIWVCVHPDGAWIWIIPFSNGRTSVGVVAPPEFFEKYAGEPEAQLRAILMSDENATQRLGKMELLFPPQRVTGYSCSVKKLFGDRFALAGNASEFLDPVFSSGVALAMASAERAAQLLVRQRRGETTDWQTDYADFLMHGVKTFRSYINGWYDGKLPTIFFADQNNRDIMRQICSVLAGYVWDKSNPYVRQADRALSALAHILGGGSQAAAR
jgi:2-polyprenyl-6-methoxyphenol hydroxylase-like FAD-dependent oxidoreductase